MSQSFSSLLLLSFALSAYPFADPPKKQSPGKWTVDDVVLQETARDFQLSPDGKQVLWVKGVMNEDAGNKLSHLVRSTPGGKDVQLTRGGESCLMPRWSPDGKYIAFLSKRASTEPKAKPDGKARAAKDDDEKEQLWIMDATGGEPWRLSDRSRKVASFAWVSSETILFLAQEDQTLHEKTTKDEKKDTSVVVDDEKNEPPVRLFRLDIEGKKIVRLTDNKDRIQSLSVSPDGKKAVTVHGRSLSYDYDQRIKPVVFLHDLASAERKQLFADGKKNVGTVRWTPDSKGFYVSHQHNPSSRYLHAYVTELYHVDATTLQERKVELDWERGLGDQADNDYREGFFPTEAGVVVLLSDGVRNKLAFYGRNGDSWKREWLTGEHSANVFGLTLSSDGKTVVYCHSKADSPIQWYHATLEKNAIQKPMAIAKINESLKNLTFAKVEVVRWKGALNEEVEGLLYYPHNHEAGKKYPLVLMIHGGPFGADYDNWDDSWAYPANLVCQRGAFVLKPNYHGSSGYGLKYAESISAGKYYDLPLTDIENGVDHLIGKGLVDPAKLATMGWSNGAILSAALIVKNQRYKAASLGAGGAEWVADWGACEFGLSFSNYYFGKTPIEDPQLYMKMAPLYQFDRIKTPTIIFHGDADRAVPTHHAWAQFRTLQQLGKTDVRLLLFPDEPHSLEKIVHQKRKVTEDMAWLEKHLFSSHKEENVALKTGSPLDRALKLKRIGRDGSRYGVKVKDVLIPETVEFQGMRLGRFEVTQAQYAQFDRNFKVQADLANYPMTGLTFEKAQEYCRWLSAQTGETYRLPNNEEGEKLFDDRESDGENVLDYWAGYAVNPDDAARLRDKIKELDGKTPLLREVGRFKPDGKDDPVFDLGGNAAEWVEVEKGKGKTLGGCAACAGDTKSRERTPPEEYVGFRVVKEVKK